MQRESSRFLKSTLNGLSSHIAVVDSLGEIVLTNKAYRDFAVQNGIEAKLVSENVNYLTVCDTSEGMYSDEANAFADGLRDVLSGKRPSFEMEYPCHSPDQQRWFVVRVTPLVGMNPKLAIVAHENITERKLSQLKLERTRNHLRVTSQLSRVGGWSLELETGRLEWSDMTREIHEVEADFHPNLDIAFHFYKEGESRQKITDAVNRCIETGEPYEHDAQIITALGKDRWIRTIGSPEFEQGRCVGIHGTIQDINDRKQNEMILNLQAKRAAALLELPKRTYDYEEKRFMQRGMELVEDLTDSKISFIHLVNHGGEEIELVAWSRRTLEHYCKAVADSHYPVSKAGIWADALRMGKPVIFNDYPNYPMKHGLPEGHSTLERLISVPVIENGHVVLLAGVGNKATDYNEFDGESVQLIATGIWQIVKEARAAKAVHEASERIDRLAHHVPGALYQFQITPDGVASMPYASMGIQEIYGVLPQQIVNDASALFDAIHPDDVADVSNSLRVSAKTLDVWRNQHRVNLPDGRMIWVEGEATPEGQPDGSIVWHGYVRDITERKREERQLLFQNILLKTQQEISLDGIGVVDEHDRFTSFNQRFADIWEIPDHIMEEQSSEKALQYVLPLLPNPDEFAERIHQLHKNRTESSFEEIDLLNGKILERYSSPMFGSDDEYYGRIWFYRDITKHRLALDSLQASEKQLETMNAELEQKVAQRTAQFEASNKELEAFSYSVSHDLRAPLRHLNGYTELLNKQFKDELPEKAVHYLDMISVASRNMATLIDDLLQYSRFGRQELVKKELDMNLMLQDVMEQFMNTIDDRTIHWDVQNLPIVFGDAVLMKQVWVNLIDNAIKYTRNIKTASISVGCKMEANDVVFFVCDNGAGFDMKYAHKLFGVFQRLHSQAEFEGSGIGLANVQRIIHKHSGRVWAQAKLGKGATFYFSLPTLFKESK